MKKLRKLAAISILLILIFMVIALFQYQKEEDITLFPDQYEIFYDEAWNTITLKSTSLPPTQPNDIGQIGEQIDKALAGENHQTVSLPYTGRVNSDERIIFQNILPETYAGLTLNFSTAAKGVRVFLDEELLYEQGFENKSTYGKTPGSNDIFVSLPVAFKEGELWIELSPPYFNSTAILSGVKIESREMVVIGVVGNNIADIGCCLLIIIMGIIMFVLALIRLYTHQPPRGELYLGLTGFAAGIYCFIGTDTLSIFYDVQEAYEMQEYLVLLLPLFLALYFERNLHMVYPRRFSALIGCTMLNAAIQIALHTLGICSLKKMINISAAAIGIICVVAIVSLIQFDYKKRYYLTLLSVFSMLVLLSGGIANIIINTIFENIHDNAAGQYSMTIFSISMVVMHTLQLSKEYRANAEENAQLLQDKVIAAEQQNLQLAQAKQDAEAARQEALAANEAKGRFLAHMSHEIRTPINAVLGMDEMILRESKEQNIKEYAMDIHMAGQTLLSLINDILDFSKIESGKMEIVPVEYDISSLIHDLANMAAQRAFDKNLKLEVIVDKTIPSRLYGDDVRLRQVLTNILTNAVKYTPAGTVWLRVQCQTNEEAALLHFEVEDTGIGMKEEDLPKLSAEFERIEEDRNRNIEGSGLGMSITIQLLSLLGSRLQVESIYGKGSKFSFILEQKIIDNTPIGDFESRVRQIANNYTYNTKLYAPNAQILVVDDNAVNRKVLRNLLKETQIQVADADSGAACLTLVQENHYDLIFLDHMMPEMDGIETLHYIKAFSDFPCKDTPIIVLTANAVSGAKEKYLSEGFDGFLSKPIMPEKLETLLKKMLPQNLQQIPPKESENTTEPESASDILESLPQVEGLDWQYAWLHLPDMELLTYTVKEFYAQIEPAAKTLERAYHQIGEPKQLEQYRIQVHAMKGLAATIGILPLYGVAKILEYAAKDGKLDVILSITTSFLEEWRSYHQKLQGVFDIGAAPSKKITDVSIIKALLEMVRISMQDMDIDQADKLINELKTYDYPEAMQELMQKLAEAVTNLDAEETEHIVSLLMQQINEIMEENKK